MMTTPTIERLLNAEPRKLSLDDYRSNIPRWCTGCGNHGILTALQRLCRDERLQPEKTVFVSGIGCSSRFPHYMKTYGFHGLHGRALPVAEGIKMMRPDLHVFVNTGDGDCCSIGTAHWIHAIRYNMDLTVLMHDNHVYGLTKKQASPTSPKGFNSNTSPRGTMLEPLNPLAVTLGVSNVSFVAQAVDWIPELLYEVVSQAFRHKGFSFVRILQRCPEFVPVLFNPWIENPDRILVLSHDEGLRPSAAVSGTYRNQQVHDPGDIDRAREIASMPECIPVGILYRRTDAPRYEELRRTDRAFSADAVRTALDEEFDKFMVRPAN